MYKLSQAELTQVKLAAFVDELVKIAVACNEPALILDVADALTPRHIGTPKQAGLFDSIGALGKRVASGVSGAAGKVRTAVGELGEAGAAKRMAAAGAAHDAAKAERAMMGAGYAAPAAIPAPFTGNAEPLVSGPLQFRGSQGRILTSPANKAAVAPKPVPVAEHMAGPIAAGKARSAELEAFRAPDLATPAPSMPAAPDLAAPVDLPKHRLMDQLREMNPFHGAGETLRGAFARSPFAATA